MLLFLLTVFGTRGENLADAAQVEKKSHSSFNIRTQKDHCLGNVWFKAKRTFFACKAQ